MVRLTAILPRRAVSRRSRATKKSAPGSASPRSEWMDPAEAAAYAKLSEKTLKRYRTKGGGPPFARPSANRVLYSRRGLDEWLESKSGTDPEDFAPYRPTVVARARA